MPEIGLPAENQTPMLRQYFRIKSAYPDSILMFRLGDFYEMFYDDAVLASNILGITLTSRNKGEPNPVPLCGVPHHSVEPYLTRLLEHGKKVAICDQMEDPRLAKGIVKREVTRVLTPGVIVDGLGLDRRTSNHLASVYIYNECLGLCWAEASTGFLAASEYGGMDELIEELGRVEPRELIVCTDHTQADAVESLLKRACQGVLVTRLEDNDFDPARLASLDGSRQVVEKMPAAARAAGGVIAYLASTQMGRISQMQRIEVVSQGSGMRLDEQTKRNLELTRTMREGDREGTLVWALDRTKTAAGARMLQRWVLYPLTDPAKTGARQGAVDAIYQEPALARSLSETLSRVYDMERIESRAAGGSANARDLKALAASLAAAGELKTLLSSRVGLLSELASQVDGLTPLCEKIESLIVDDPPLSVKEGGLIRPGVDKELDEIRDAIAGGKRIIAGMEDAERAATGIGSLKIRFNRVFGYYIEVTNAHKEKVPERYTRRQTLANAERFITPELKEHEEKVLGGEERSRAMEHEIFMRLREEAAARVREIQRTAGAMAAIDVLQSFARVAAEYDYVRPVVDDSQMIELREARHPIVERMCAERFVPNDVSLGGEDQKLLMITGPNMAGKSTVMRQTALIVLMAQIGSFVPAEEARIGVVDRIFTRVGASDALSQGQSTFMVEMSEAALILRHASERSLVIIDEIGRGTSTFDGLAIAWAVAEDLHDRVAARTMFATHYHELTDLALTKPGIANFHIAVREWNGKIIFLRKLMSGSTSHSYGIQVAALAGLPDGVISRAREVLANLEAGEFDEAGRPRIGGEPPSLGR